MIKNPDMPKKLFVPDMIPVLIGNIRLPAPKNMEKIARPVEIIKAREKRTFIEILVRKCLSFFFCGFLSKKKKIYINKIEFLKGGCCGAQECVHVFVGSKAG